MARTIINIITIIIIIVSTTINLDFFQLRRPGRTQVIKPVFFSPSSFPPPPPPPPFHTKVACVNRTKEKGRIFNRENLTFPRNKIKGGDENSRKGGKMLLLVVGGRSCISPPFLLLSFSSMMLSRTKREEEKKEGRKEGSRWICQEKSFSPLPPSTPMQRSSFGARFNNCRILPRLCFFAKLFWLQKVSVPTPDHASQSWSKSLPRRGRRMGRDGISLSPLFFSTAAAISTPLPPPPPLLCINVRFSITISKTLAPMEEERKEGISIQVERGKERRRRRGNNCFTGNVMLLTPLFSFHIFLSPHFRLIRFDERAELRQKTFPHQKKRGAGREKSSFSLPPSVYGKAKWWDGEKEDIQSIILLRRRQRRQRVKKRLSSSSSYSPNMQSHLEEEEEKV